MSKHLVDRNKFKFKSKFNFENNTFSNKFILNLSGKLSYSLKSFLILTTFMTGCSSPCHIPKIKTDCCFPLQRPQVLVSSYDCVIDYNECFEEFSFGDCPPESLAALARAPLTPDMFDPYAPLDEDYRLARGDVLEVGIIGETDAAVQNAIIAPDGKLYYGVLDGIEAEGRTPEEVAEELTTKLKDLYVDPKVTIVPTVTYSYTYRILGRIQGPGEYILKGPISLRAAINEAGGIISETSKDTVNYPDSRNVPLVNFSESFLVRGDQKLDINFEDLIYTGDSSQDIYIRPGDYIYIAPSDQREVFVLGYVSAPQRLPYMEGMTLMTTLAAVGGWPTPGPYSPDMSRFLVIRGSLWCPHVCRVDLCDILEGRALDVRLEPGDIVYAQHKQFRFGRELMYLAVESFISAFVGSACAHWVNSHLFGPIDTSDNDDDIDD